MATKSRRTFRLLTAGLGWTVKLDKGAEFVGRPALVAEKQNGSSHQVVFFKTGDRRIVRADTPVLDESRHNAWGASSPVRCPRS